MDICTGSRVHLHFLVWEPSCIYSSCSVVFVLQDFHSTCCFEHWDYAWHWQIPHLNIVFKFWMTCGV